jgi:hypothetical protein
MMIAFDVNVHVRLVSVFSISFGAFNDDFEKQCKDTIFLSGVERKREISGGK